LASGHNLLETFTSAIPQNSIWYLIERFTSNRFNAQKTIAFCKIIIRYSTNIKMENYGIKSLLLIERFFLGHQVANLQRT
jgi:hypothetical protein